jgi:diacylglycerol kinase (ATP)
MPKRTATVLYNAKSGDTTNTATELDLIGTTLRELNVTAQVIKIEPGLDIPTVTQQAARGGAQYVIAVGGDNTIDAAARGLIGTHSRLVIVPTGTRNNIAHSLNIPTDIHEAMRLIADGERIKVDMGWVRAGGREIFFLELVAVGLAAAMFPALDETQKGNLAKLGDLLGTFITHPASNFRLNLDRGRQKLEVQALTLAVMNMPFLGANFQLAPNVDSRDGLLDVFVYADFGKLDMLTYAAQVAQGFTDDPRVKHLRIKSLVVETDPPLPIMVDGEMLESGRLDIRRSPRALRVMVPKTV